MACYRKGNFVVLDSLVLKYLLDLKMWAPMLKVSCIIHPVVFLPSSSVLEAHENQSSSKESIFLLLAECSQNSPVPCPQGGLHPGSAHLKGTHSQRYPTIRIKNRMKSKLPAPLIDLCACYRPAAALKAYLVPSRLELTDT